MKKGSLRGKGISRIVIVKARNTAECAEEGCSQIIERGALCHARRPGEQYFCSSCAAQKPGWPLINKSNFVDPLKASKQAVERVKRKHRDKEMKKNVD